MTNSMDDHTQQMVRRWRLALGKFSQIPLQSVGLSQEDFRINRTLDYLYNREYRHRGLHVDSEDSSGGSEASIYKALEWLTMSRKIFPKETFEEMQFQAIERYEISDLLKDPEAIRAIEPNQNVVKLLMNLRGKLSEEVLDAMRDVIQKVVEDILRRLKRSFDASFAGQRNRFRRSMLASSQNFDWRATFRANLKHYDVENARMILANPIFYSRQKQKLKWDVILCLDQSASMSSSIIYASICATILSSLPFVNVKLVVFDTQVVDLSHLAHDPLDILMTINLGGGTYINQAVQYCENLVTNPSRTVFTLISDFEEGGNLQQLLNTIRRMHSNRIKLLGLAALDDQANPVYDRQIAQKLADRGMHIAALTPEHFAEWLAGVMQ